MGVSVGRMFSGRADGCRRDACGPASRRRLRAARGRGSSPHHATTRVHIASSDCAATAACRPGSARPASMRSRSRASTSGKSASAISSAERAGLVTATEDDAHEVALLGGERDQRLHARAQLQLHVRPSRLGGRAPCGRAVARACRRRSRGRAPACRGSAGRRCPRRRRPRARSGCSWCRGGRRGRSARCPPRSAGAASRRASEPPRWSGSPACTPLSIWLAADAHFTH